MQPQWGSGFEGQRIADLGNGKYRNPVVPGDHADPAILKDGDDYWMTFSSFEAVPGVEIWHSRDLVNWEPKGFALQKPLGSVWAMDIAKHGGRYFIYIPALLPAGGSGIFVIHADSMEGPWSDPVDLGIPGCIDPGHAVDEDGGRWLFVNGIRRIRLSDDGLSVQGEVEHVLHPWQYPEDWVVEMFAPEGPKIFRRGAWFYLVSAVGGTAGPATSHMVTVARAKSLHGPWEHSPRNPMIRTASDAEPWWSRGHATLVEGPAGDWWMVYHGYENGYRTLGRQTLLEPMSWSADGWPVARGGDLSRPLPKPRKGQALAAGRPLSGFGSDGSAPSWSFYCPGPADLARRSGRGGILVLASAGTGMHDSVPLTLLPGDRTWQAEVTLEPRNGATGAFGLYYSRRMYCGIGFDGTTLYTSHYGEEHSWMRQPLKARTLRIRLENRGQVATWWHSADNGPWVRHPWQMEIGGMNHNVFGGFTALKPALFSMGSGETAFRDFTWKGGNHPDLKA